MAVVEAVEKVDLARIRQVGRKYELSGCSVYDDLMLGKDQETPENILLTRQRDFSYRLVRQRELNEEKDIIELE